MLAADIMHGDILVFMEATGSDVQDGQVVAAMCNGEVCVKRYRVLDGIPFLMSDPIGYMAPLRVSEEVTVVGVPVGYLRYKPAVWG
jgi:hypothetical protein